MSRSVQVGDLAYIDDKLFFIQNITDHGIYIIPPNNPEKVSLLVPPDWKIYDYNQPHTVFFEAAPKQFLLGITELDEKILLNLDYAKLQVMCRTNQYAHSLCKNDMFWQAKIKRDFNEDALRLKRAHLSHKEFYEILHEQERLKSRLPNLKTTNQQIAFTDRFKYRFSPTLDEVKTALYNNDLETLAWLEEHGLVPTQEIADQVLEDALIEKNLENLDNQYKLMQKIAGNPREILDHLVERGIFPSQEKVTEVFMPSSTFIEAIDATGQAIQLLAEPSTEINQWLLNRSISPTSKAANEAAVRNNFEILEELARIGILPTEEAANEALMQLNSEMLNWLAQYNIHPSRENVDVIHQMMSPELLKQLIPDFIQ